MSATFVQLATKDPAWNRMRPLRPGQPWHILTKDKRRTLCGKSMLQVASVSQNPGVKVCKKCGERIHRVQR